MCSSARPKVDPDCFITLYIVSRECQTGCACFQTCPDITDKEILLGEECHWLASSLVYLLFFLTWVSSSQPAFVMLVGFLFNVLLGILWRENTSSTVTVARQLNLFQMCAY